MNPLFVPSTTSNVDTNFDPHDGTSIVQFGVGMVFWCLCKYSFVVKHILGSGGVSVVFPNIPTVPSITSNVGTNLDPHDDTSIV